MQYVFVLVLCEGGAEAAIFWLPWRNTNGLECWERVHMEWLRNAGTKTLHRCACVCLSVCRCLSKCTTVYGLWVHVWDVRACEWVVYTSCLVLLYVLMY